MKCAFVCLLCPVAPLIAKSIHRVLWRERERETHTHTQTTREPGKERADRRIDVDSVKM